MNLYPCEIADGERRKTGNRQRTAGSQKNKIMEMRRTALIMAGGRGERFWPKSRQQMPKQFLSLTGDGKTMIQLTVERILPLVAIEDIYIATNQDYKKLVMEQLPQIPEKNILCEPVGRNTAPCVGLGAVHIAKKYSDAVMMVLPADSLVKENVLFVENLKEACMLAQEGENLITLGITPNYPETGYGYIRFLAEHRRGNAYEVDRFVEKPDLETAKTYLATGKYLWNSGMFIWKVSTILNKMRLLMPATYEGLQSIYSAIATEKEDEVLDTVFRGFESQSVDYGILEKSDNIYTIPGNFGWDDVGSWLAVGRIRENDTAGNVISGDVIAVGTQNCIIEGSNKLIAAVGLENLIVVDSENAILICSKEQTGNIKKVLEELKKNAKKEYI